MRWQVQEAKQRFSELIRAAESGEPQIVTRHGEEIAVVLPMSEYRRLQGESLSFVDFLLTMPVLDEGLVVERSREMAREIDLSE